MSAPRGHGRRADAGVTLIELIITVAVSAVVLALIASLVASTVQAQVAATQRSATTAEAAVVVGSLQSSIRNAGAVRVEPDGRALRAQVAAGDSGWECRAWVLTGSGELRYTTAADAIPLEGTSGWATLTTGANGPASGAGPFAAAGRHLSYEFAITARGETVPVVGGVVAQAVAAGAEPCW